MSPPRTLRQLLFDALCQVTPDHPQQLVPDEELVVKTITTAVQDWIADQRDVIYDNMPAAGAIIMALQQRAAYIQQDQ